MQVPSAGENKRTSDGGTLRGTIQIEMHINLVPSYPRRPNYLLTP